MKYTICSKGWRVWAVSAWNHAVWGTDHPKCFWQNNFIRLFQFSWSEESCSDECSGVRAVKHLYLQDSSVVFEGHQNWISQIQMLIWSLWKSCWKLSTESWAPADYLCCPFLKISNCNSNLMENLFGCNSISSHQISTKFCTCHHCHDMCKIL